MTRDSTAAGELSTLSIVRRALLWTLLFGAAGMMTELLLIGHDESAAQLIPLLLLASCVVTVIVVLVGPTAPRLRLLQGLMLLFVASGMVGVGLHYQGNHEFELEMYPALSGLELMSKTFTGATPVLAPGSMSLLGVVGLVFTYRHPHLRKRDGEAEEVLS
jgi:hypothetical protein